MKAKTTGITMNGTKPQSEAAFAGPIHDRIGPIVDYAFLKLLPNEVVKEISLIRAKALQSTIHAELAAAEQLVKVIEKAHI
jgi:hypothetical protein